MVQAKEKKMFCIVSIWAFSICPQDSIMCYSIRVCACVCGLLHVTPETGVHCDGFVKWLYLNAYFIIYLVYIGYLCGIFGKYKHQSCFMTIIYNLIDFIYMVNVHGLKYSYS